MSSHFCLCPPNQSNTTASLPSVRAKNKTLLHLPSLLRIYTIILCVFLLPQPSQEDKGFTEKSISNFLTAVRNGNIKVGTLMCHVTRMCLLASSREHAAVMHCTHLGRGWTVLPGQPWKRKYYKCVCVHMYGSLFLNTILWIYQFGVRVYTIIQVSPCTVCTHTATWCVLCRADDGSSPTFPEWRSCPLPLAGAGLLPDHLLPETTAQHTHQQEEEEEGWGEGWAGPQQERGQPWLCEEEKSF